MAKMTDSAVMLVYMMPMPTPAMSTFPSLPTSAMSTSGGPNSESCATVLGHPSLAIAANSRSRVQRDVPSVSCSHGRLGDKRRGCWHMTTAVCVTLTAVPGPRERSEGHPECCWADRVWSSAVPGTGTVQYMWPMADVVAKGGIGRLR
eukprot:3899520-Prymnesium_polylepis.2